MGETGPGGAIGGTLRDIVVKYCERVDQHIRDDEVRERNRDAEHSFDVAERTRMHVENTEARRSLHKVVDDVAEAVGRLELKVETAIAAEQTKRHSGIVNGLKWAIGALTTLAGALAVFIFTKR